MEKEGEPYGITAPTIYELWSGLVSLEKSEKEKQKTISLIKEQVVYSLNKESAEEAGRIDGDGHIDTKHRSGIRIAYSSKDDALRDQKLFGETNVSLYQYKAARTFVLYLKKNYRQRISKEIKKYSVKFAP